MSPRVDAGDRAPEPAGTSAALARAGRAVAHGDPWLVLTAAGAVGGAAWARPVPLALGAGAAALALVAALALRHPWPLAIGTLVLASCLGARALDGLAPPPPEAFSGEVTLLSDPELRFGSVRADVGVDGRRLDAWVRGPGAGRFRSLLAGERVELTGRLSPPPAHAPWLVPRHVVGRLVVTEVGEARSGHPVTVWANGLRRLLVEGAEPLPEVERSLFLGLLLGDVRDQDELVADEFRASGLTHLLAVSGQNVAFVLALAGPVLSRLGLRGRLGATLALLGFFALVTRFEASVLRATTMAALAATAASTGRPASGLRLLALAVGGLVLVDPLLVRSLAFQLSVGASLGILVLAGPVSRALPGPRPLADALAVTIAAQAGVAPVQIPLFGGIPVASLPANVAAGPAAGPVVAWGFTGGVIAGVLGGPVAGVLQVPTRLLVGWIAGVARWGASLPLGELQGPHVVAAGVVGVLLVVARRRSSRLGTVACLLGLCAVAAHPGLELRAAPPAQLEVASGAVVLDGAVLVLDGARSPGAVLEGLRRSGVRHPTLAVATTGGAHDARVLALVRRRHPSLRIVAPAGHRVPGAVSLRVAVRVGSGWVVRPEGDRLVLVAAGEG